MSFSASASTFSGGHKTCIYALQAQRVGSSFEFASFVPPFAYTTPTKGHSEFCSRIFEVARMDRLEFLVHSLLARALSNVLRS